MGVLGQWLWKASSSFRDACCWTDIHTDAWSVDPCVSPDVLFSHHPDAGHSPSMGTEGSSCVQPVLLASGMCRHVFTRFPVSAVVKNLPANAGDTRDSGENVRAGAGLLGLPCSLAHLPASHGVPPSGLFIVESVFICFIMKNKFAEVY